MFLSYAAMEDMKKDMKMWEIAVFIIVIIGAINWLITGLSVLVLKKTSITPDLFSYIGLGGSIIQPLVYLVVGGAGVAAAVSMGITLKKESEEE